VKKLAATSVPVFVDDPVLMAVKAALAPVRFVTVV